MLDLIAGNDFLSSILAFALVLIPAIIIHELGHFFAAKAIGVTVLEFGVGFPPRIARLFMWGETEFTLNWIPLGGFVRPLGEDMIRPVSDNEAIERDRQTVIDRNKQSNIYISERDELKARGVTRMMAVHEAKPLPRIFFMAAGAIANFLSAFLLFFFIGLIGVPEITGARLQIIDLPQDSFLSRTVIEKNDGIERVNGTLFADAAEFFELLQESAGKPVTLTMLSFETGENYEVTVNLPTDIQFSGYIYASSLQVDSPADLAGIKPGDLILAFNGEALSSAFDPVASMQSSTEMYAGKNVTLTVLRGDKQLEITLVPLVTPPEGRGRMGIAIEPRFNLENGLMLASADPQFALIPQSIWGSVQYGVEETIGTFQLIAEIPHRIVQGSLTAEEARPVSIIGISQIGGGVLQDSIVENRPTDLLRFMALISIFLGATQLLPIPALDGGRIMFVLIEIIRGRPISPEREGFVHLVGIVVLLSLGVIIMFYDLINPPILP